MSETTSSNTLSNHTPTSVDEAPISSQPESGSPRSKKVLLLVAALVLVGLIAGVGFYFHTSQNSYNETVAYTILENNDNPQDYEDFLAKYPDSPYAPEVKKRLQQVESMLQRWATISLSDQVSDFVRFKEQFNYLHYVHLCDLKIDSLDFIHAQRLGTEAAFQSYLDTHPDGRYASEASIAQGTLRDQEITPEEREQVVSVIQNFFEGFEARDETVICSNITATMDHFLHQSNITKAAVVETINQMYNEHIQDCQFIVNRDIQVTRQSGSPTAASFTVKFTVDQHIQRDDEGKTFGSYQCTAQVTPQLLISSLTMEEISRQ